MTSKYRDDSLESLFRDLEIISVSSPFEVSILPLYSYFSIFTRCLGCASHRYRLPPLHCLIHQGERRDPNQDCNQSQDRIRRI